MNWDPKPYVILVIEDNPGDLVIVKELLAEQMTNTMVVHANNFEEASGVLAESGNVFDVILLDLTLPDKDGHELTTAMLRVAMSCPIIILTGYTDISFSIGSIAMGISDYLLKDDLASATLYKSIIYSIERRKLVFNLRKSERRYSDLFHLSPQPMWVCEADTLRFLDVNNSAIQEYGYTREEFLMLTFNDIVVKQDAGPQEGTDPALIDDVRDKFKGIWSQKRKNNEWREVSIHSNLIMSGDKTAILMLADDVTERIRYTTAIEKQNKKLREIAWMQSHIVRAPLTRMMGIVSLIGELKLLPSDGPDLLKRFTESFLELDAVIREIAKQSEQIEVNSQTYGL